jgi:hypothetical protein
MFSHPAQNLIPAPIEVTWLLLYPLYFNYEQEMDQNISTSLLLFHEVQDKSSGCLLE